MGTDTVLDVPMGNVQRETFNSQLSMGLPKGRMEGWIWGQTRNLDDRTFDPADLSKHGSGGPSRLWRRDMGTDTVFDVPMRNVQRETLNSQLSTG